MIRIGFIGLGTMGLPMANNLLKAGYDLVVYNRSREKSESLKAKGAQVVASPAEVAQSCTVLFTMLSNDAVIEEVYFGPQGIKFGVREGQILIDSSTISPKMSLKLATEFASLGVEVLDAPVMGIEKNAVEGSLSFMVGGKQRVYEQVLPLLNCLGQKTFYMGANGNGSYTKLANNTIGAINLLGFSEGLILATKAGIDPQIFVQTIAGGARSGMVEQKSQKFLDGDYKANFMTSLMHKDLTLAQQIAEEKLLPMPVLSLVREMLQLAIASGYASEDVCSVLKCYEQWAGVQVSGDKASHTIK